jgi:hypothetical protein
LLRAAHAAFDHHRTRFLLELDAGKPDSALGHAIRCHELRPDTGARRLLTICALAMQDWETALKLERSRSPEEST